MLLQFLSNQKKFVMFFFLSYHLQGMQCHPAEIALTKGISKKWLKIIASNVLQGRGESSVWMLRFAQHDR